MGRIAVTRVLLVFLLMHRAFRSRRQVSNALSRFSSCILKSLLCMIRGGCLPMAGAHVGPARAPSTGTVGTPVTFLYCPNRPSVAWHIWRFSCGCVGPVPPPRNSRTLLSIHHKAYLVVLTIGVGSSVALPGAHHISIMPRCTVNCNTILPHSIFVVHAPCTLQLPCAGLNAPAGRNSRKSTSLMV